MPSMYMRMALCMGPEVRGPVQKSYARSPSAHPVQAHEKHHQPTDIPRPIAAMNEDSAGCC